MGPSAIAVRDPPWLAIGDTVVRNLDGERVGAVGFRVLGDG